MTAPVKCRAEGPGGFVCTHPAGHGGDHQADDSTGLGCCTWPRDHRAEVIAGLRELAQFLQDHPGLPYDKNAKLTVFPGTDTDTEGDAAQRAEVDAAAAILGTTPTLERSGHYMVERQFAGVEYRVCHIPDGELPPCEAVSPDGSVPCKGVAGHDGDHAAEGPDGKIAHVWRQS